MARALLLLVVASCGGHPQVPDAGVPDGSVDATAYVAGAATVLSTSSPGDDEDPAILRARDDSIYVAWFSHGAGDDIMISRTMDGVHWSAPAHVTTGAPIDFGPTLYQDAAGYIHVAWFRWATAPPGKIVHVRAAQPDDATAWGSEVDVTNASATDDWVPTLTANAAGNLVVAFARNTCPPPNTCYGIAAATSIDGGATWGASSPVVAAGSGLEHHLPAIANTGSELVLAWDPFSDTANAPWDSAQTGAHISLVHSATGATWTGASDVTTAQANTVTLYPTLYTDHASAWHLAWMTATATSQSIVSVPLAAPSAAPVTLPIDGYSPRVVATPTPGIDLAAWVAGPMGERDIYVRVFAEP